MKNSSQAAAIFNDIVDIVRAVRSNKKIELFRGGMEKLNVAQMALLYFLYDSKAGMAMGELAKSAGVKMPTMTDIVSPLVKAGYAMRTHADNDRRKVIMTITEKGRRLVDYNRGIGIDYIEKYLSKLNHIEKNIAMMVVKRTKEVLTKRFEK
jgi:MarR family transcriptional regulator, organic hydroperoxide resistance regulator